MVTVARGVCIRVVFNFWHATVSPNCNLVLHGRSRTAKLGPKIKVLFCVHARKIALVGTVDKRDND